jgi:hypothetical protein
MGLNKVSVGALALDVDVLADESDAPILHNWHNLLILTIQEES